MRLLGEGDLGAVLRALDADPIANCMVAARVQERGMAPKALQGELWTYARPQSSLCFSGANLVPIAGSTAALRAFADGRDGVRARAPRSSGPPSRS